MNIRATIMRVLAPGGVFTCSSLALPEHGGLECLLPKWVWTGDRDKAFVFDSLDLADLEIQQLKLAGEKHIHSVVFGAACERAREDRHRHHAAANAAEDHKERHARHARMLQRLHLE